MGINMRLKYYTSREKSLFDNLCQNYILVYIKEANLDKRYIITPNQFRTDMTLLKPFKNNSTGKNVVPTGLNETFHYCVVLTFNATTCRVNPAGPKNKELLFNLANEYCKERRLDVISMWYDNNENKFMIHYNLYMSCGLLLEYFVVLFDAWKFGIGMLWVDYMRDPITWRVYASILPTSHSKVNLSNPVVISAPMPVVIYKKYVN